MESTTQPPRPSDQQAKIYADELQVTYVADHVGKLAGPLFDAQVEPNPHHKALPRESRFPKDGGRRERNQRVIAKLGESFKRFIGPYGGDQ